MRKMEEKIQSIPVRKKFWKWWRTGGEVREGKEKNTKKYRCYWFREKKNDRSAAMMKLKLWTRTALILTWLPRNRWRCCSVYFASWGLTLCECVVVRWRLQKSSKTTTRPKKDKKSRWTWVRKQQQLFGFKKCSNWELETTTPKSKM